MSDEEQHELQLSGTKSVSSTFNHETVSCLHEYVYLHNNMLNTRTTNAIYCYVLVCHKHTSTSNMQTSNKILTRRLHIFFDN